MNDENEPEIQFDVEPHIPELNKQVEQIGLELLQTTKLIGYRGNPDTESVMGHYYCSELAASAGIALYHQLCNNEGIEYPEFGLFAWIRRKLHRPPKTDKQEHGERSD